VIIGPFAGRRFADRITLRRFIDDSAEELTGCGKM
jgi:hypothetical protein